MIWYGRRTYKGTCFNYNGNHNHHAWVNTIPDRGTYETPHFYTKDTALKIMLYCFR